MDIFEFIQFLWKRRVRIAIILFIALIFIVITVLLLPKEYTATAVILPPSEEGIGGGLLSRYSSMASLIGVNVGGGNVGPNLYQDIITSKKILEPIIEARYQTNKFPDKKVNLIDYFEIKEDNPRKSLEVCFLKVKNEVVSVGVNPETFVAMIRVTTREPKLSARIARKLVIALEDFNKNTIQREAVLQREFIQTRLNEINAGLKRAEDNLQSFLENVDDITTPKAQIEVNRLRRQIELQSAILIEMKKQQEIYKVKEFTDLASLKVLDEPTPPELRSFPKRKMIIILFMIGISFLIMSYYLIVFYRQNTISAGEIG